jgi:hypothetical protein
MNDELEPGVALEDPPEETTPEAQPPAWDFGDPNPTSTPPTTLTEADIRRIMREEREAGDQREPDFEEQIINRAVDRASQMMQQQMAQVTAPAARRELVEDLTVGLDTPAKEYLNEYFKSFTADSIAVVRADKATMDMLRRAAEYESGSKVSKPAPRSEGTSTVTEIHDDNFERSIDAMWNGGFASVPGLTKEKFREEMKRRVK